MAHISANNIITINRGDTFIYSFYIGIGEPMHQTIYELQPGDKLYLGVCEPNQPFEDALIKKIFTSSDVSSEGAIDIVFDASDTLNILPGDYYYSIKLSQPNLESSGAEDIVTTIIPRTKFVIIE